MLDETYWHSKYMRKNFFRKKKNLHPFALFKKSNCQKKKFPCKNKNPKKLPSRKNTPFPAPIISAASSARETPRKPAPIISAAPSARETLLKPARNGPAKKNGREIARFSARMVKAWEMLLTHHNIQYHLVGSLHTLGTNSAQVADSLLNAVFNDTVVR